MQTVVCRVDPQRLSAVPRQPLILVPVRDMDIPAMSSMMSPAPCTSRGPRPILPRATPQRPPPEPSPNEGSLATETSRRGWTTLRGEQLRKKIEQRPSRERLLNQHILLSDGRVAPLIEQRARLLRQDRIRRSLSRKLEARPGPLELVTRKILQADADLEQAIEEGRVLFQPTSEHVVEEECEMLSPISTDMEVVSQAAIRAQSKPVNVLSNKGMIRKKSTPYKNCDPLPLRAKTKAPDSREDDEVTVVGEICSPSDQAPRNSEQNSNYELLLQQQKLFLQWQQNDESSTQTQDGPMQIHEMQPSSPTASPSNQMAVRRLSDYKVQELKNECKKRQLPVSGAKPQLLERLRPFEKAILGASPPSTPEPTQYSTTSTGSVSNSNCSTVTSSSTPELQQQPLQQHQQLQSQQLLLQQPLQEIHEPSMPSQPAVQCQQQPTLQVQPQAVPEQMRGAVGIHDYVGRPLVLQLSPQLVQLTDAKGTPVGVASVQYIPGSGHPVVLSYHPRGAPQIVGSQPIAPIQPGSSSPTTHERVTHIIPIQQSSVPTQTQTVIANVHAAIAQPRVIQTTHVVQKENDNTFRFAQMGSGGQFTVASSSERPPAKGASMVMKTTGSPHAILASPKNNVTSIIGLTQQPAQLSNASTHKGPVVVTFQPATTTYASLAQNGVPLSQSNQANVAQSCYTTEPLNPCPQDSPRTADLAGDSPHMPNSGQSEAVAETGDGTVENPITFDDPSSVLTPAALSMHEEMLRTQQKKIETLLEELAKGQAHLKQEQQLILTAKKAQQRIREKQRESTANREREQWLRELDVGHINKQHIQHFLQHKKHQATLQRHTMEHNRLATTEARLQEELHVEQAVQDIVRLIKQDPRTALLIVQLLRKYQLERNAEQQQASSPDTDKVASGETNSPASVLVPSDHAYEATVPNYEQKPTVIEEEAQSIVICDASGIQLQHEPAVGCHRNGCFEQNGKQETVDMEEIFKSVLEDASRAMESNVPTVQSPDYTVTNGVQPAQAVVVCHQHWQQPTQLSEMEIEGPIPQTESQQPHLMVAPTTTNSDLHVTQPTHTIMANSHNPEQQLHLGYSQDIDDLMAVLRDDQDGGSRGPCAFQMDLGVGYGSEELADLLGDDWLDCADGTITNNGEYTPYINESHDSVGGRSTDPMCMTSSAEEVVGDQNMDWLDVMLQNAPIEQRAYGT